MALVPCRVCGTLNSEDTEICLSCEYPITGRPRNQIFQWAALVVVAAIALPFLASVAQNLLQPKPARPPAPNPQVSRLDPAFSK
jgi:uncharacterized paraquat-inducible protein A